MSKKQPAVIVTDVDYQTVCDMNHKLEISATDRLVRAEAAEALAEHRLDEIVRLKHDIAALERNLISAASVVVTLTQERDKATNIAAELLRRLEDAQARAGQLEAECDAAMDTAREAVVNQIAALKAERDAAQLELQQIRTMLDDGTSGNDNSALAMVKRLQAHDYAMQREAWYGRM